jgi:hypothetical protein
LVESGEDADVAGGGLEGGVVEESFFSFDDDELAGVDEVFL